MPFKLQLKKGKKSKMMIFQKYKEFLQLREQYEHIYINMYLYQVNFILNQPIS